MARYVWITPEGKAEAIAESAERRSSISTPTRSAQGRGDRITRKRFGFRRDSEETENVNTKRPAVSAGYELGKQHEGVIAGKVIEFSIA